MGLYGPNSVEEFDHMHDKSAVQPVSVPSAVARLRERCAAQPGSFLWVGLLNPDKEELLEIAEIFDLAPLQVEDALNTGQRAKFDFDDSGHGLAVMKVLDYVEDSSDVNTGQISIFIGMNFAVTVRLGSGGDLGSLRKSLEANPVLRSQGSVAVLYAVLDKVVDEYVGVSEEVNIDVEELETAVFNTKTHHDNADRIYRLKRENVEIRRAVGPLVNVAHDLVEQRITWLPMTMQPYFRDIGEHLLRVHDEVEGTDTLLLTMLMAATSLQDLQQNKDMRKISSWVAIAAVPTMIAAIYGMNFDNMPELHSPVGYPVVLGVMAIACVTLYRAFRRSGWL
jgi:magnesium transporter